MNIELKTVTKVISSQASRITLGGQVPSGMKRWVTFLTLDSIHQAGVKSVRLYLASVGISNPSIASIVLTSNRKMMLDLRATGLLKKLSHVPDGSPLMVPDKPDSNKPLFSIASGKWMGAYVSKTTALVLIQYFDE